MEKVKIRIALAVTADGKWNCAGWSDGDEDDMMGLAVDALDPGEARYWITAEVDLPKTAEVEANVEPAV